MKEDKRVVYVTVQAIKIEECTQEELIGYIPLEDETGQKYKLIID